MYYFLKHGLLVSLLYLLASTAIAENQPVKEQKALDALTQMGSYLQTQKKFTVNIAVNVDRVLTNNQLIQSSYTIQLQVELPNHLKADFSGRIPGKSKHAYYDGQSFTLHTLPSNYYAIIDAPATFKELNDSLQREYGIEVPLYDLFSIGVDTSLTEQMISAVYIGDETVGDKICSHYAYQEKEIDWQIWIQKGSTPLPCKLNIVTLTDDAHPQYTATYKWNLSPKLNAKSFQYLPSKDAKKIDILRISE